MIPPSSLVPDPLGLRPVRDGGFHANLWAPAASAVAVVVDPAGASPDSVEASRAGRGMWSATLSQLRHGDRYLIEVDGERWRDPWSRWQPDGCEGTSAALDPKEIGAVPIPQRRRPPRPDIEPSDRVVYELHVGAFTRGGGLVEVVPHLDRLVDLGISHIELMPVNQFPGRHGWGYDGIFWSAVQHSYGGPGALVALVDAAHERGLGVIADVVYNHVGPTGREVYEAFGPFFTDRHHTAWGDAVNVDGPGSDVVRETVLQAAEWFVGELGVDGLRVDACHAIVDQSARHVLAELTARVRAVHPDALLIAESGLNDPRTVTPEADGGWGFDADWADDVHHSIRALLTGDRRAWLGDFGTVEDLARSASEPYLHDGRWSEYRQRRFGAPAAHLEPHRFVAFSHNHDQVGNRPFGDRLPPDVRDLAALIVLLGPYTPLLFMGEELGATAPFLFFTDHINGFIADATREGRRREFAHLAEQDDREIPDPQDPGTFERSWLGESADPATADRYRQLLALRRSLRPGRPAVAFDEQERWIRFDHERHAVACNVSPESVAVPCPRGEVLLATDPARRWTGTPGAPALELAPWSGAVVEVEGNTER